ncbi:MAG: signal peptidase II [Peptococcia bacterium]
MIILWLTAIIIFLLDRFTKYLVKTNMEPGQTIPVIQDFFHLTYIENSGAAFGILKNRTWPLILVTIVILVFLIYLAYTMARNNKWLLVSLGLIIGGALGNLLDRIQTGLVVDFFDFRGIWSFIFNVADVGVVVGVIILAWRIILMEKQE